MFHPCPKTLFKQGVILGLRQFPLKPLFYSFSCFSLFWSQKTFLAKIDTVHENAPCFSLPDTNSVRQFYENTFFHVAHFWMTTFKNTIFIGFLAFSILSFFCFSVSNIEKTKQKCNFLFENLIGDVPTILQKKTFWHKLTLFVFINILKNTIKWGMYSEKHKKTWARL